MNNKASGSQSADTDTAAGSISGSRSGAMNVNTKIAHSGGSPKLRHGVVNPPVYRASTVLFESVAELDAASADPFNRVYYGRHGTPTTFALEEAIAALDQTDRCIAVSSGLAAITTVLLAILKPGDHLLMVDSVYGPTRGLCDSLLKANGIVTEYYSPRIGADIAKLMRPNTRLVFCESPGSLTFEVQDLPAIRAAVGDTLIAIDNTWATPLLLPAIALGADIVIHAATKYIVGHSDAMLGAISCSDQLHGKLKRTAVMLGNCPGSEECYLGLRGLRTLPVRLEAHQRNALEVANWFEQQTEVAEVCYPALASSPDYALWQRDFSGASGLFGVILKPCDKTAVNAFVDALTLFGIGFSWGGFESLVLPTDHGLQRAIDLDLVGPTLRFHIGLEAKNDLIADLQSAWPILRAAITTTEKPG